MALSLEHVLWLVLSGVSSCVIGVCLYFIKRLVERTEKTIDQVTILNERINQLARMEKRIEAIEEVTSNLNRLISSEFARVNESLKWLQRNRLK